MCLAESVEDAESGLRNVSETTRKMQCHGWEISTSVMLRGAWFNRAGSNLIRYEISEGKECFQNILGGPREVPQ